MQSTIHHTSATLANKAPHHRHTVTVIMLSAIALLLAALAMSITFHVLNAQKYAAAQRQIAALESRLDEQSGALAENSAKIEEQENTIREQENKLQQQNSTISDLDQALIVKKNFAGKKLVALTFDDGPGPYTERLLDAMKERGVKATFFVLGSRVNQYQDTIRRMEAEGHAIGNHSQSHKNLCSMSAEQIKTDLDTCAARVRAVVGHNPVVMRCPGGNYNDNVKAYARSAGIPIIQWTVDTRDWENRNVNSIMKTAFQSGRYGIHDGSIVLMHDIYSSSVEAAIQMMDRLTDEGYMMVTVPELLPARQNGGQAGQIYS